MTTDTTVLPLGDFRAIWVYALNVSDADWGALLSDARDPEDDSAVLPLPKALGLRGLDTDFIDFMVNDELEALKLSSLLIEAHGMDADSVAPDAARLDALRGQVLLVHSSALGSKAPSTDPEPPLTFVGRYSEALKMDATPMAPDTSQIAAAMEPSDPVPPKKKPSDAAMSGRVATVALLVMALLVWLMIWIAG